MLQFHHVGCIVEDIDESVRIFLATHPGATVSSKFHISSQQVSVCFAELGPGSYLEFVQADGPESAVAGLKKRRISYYHLAYKTTDFDEALNSLDKIGYMNLGTFNSEAFGGKRCSFLMAPDNRLIELIENP